MTVLRLHGDDDVAVTTEPSRGDQRERFWHSSSRCGSHPCRPQVRYATPRTGATVHKYGSIIGIALQPIPTGAHVHTPGQRASGGAPE